MEQSIHAFFFKKKKKLPVYHRNIGKEMRISIFSSTSPNLLQEFLSLTVLYNESVTLRCPQLNSVLTGQVYKVGQAVAYHPL